jgi:transcription antitermination factor NusG
MAYYIKEIKEVSFIKKSALISQPAWFVFYTLPRAEKLVYQDLLKNDYIAFLPTTKSLRVWKNRQKKWIEEVLFPNYIFVYMHSNELHKIIRMPKIVTYIHCGGKPSVIRNKEIEAIQKMICHYQNVCVEKIPFFGSEKVKITIGPLAGFEGILLEQKGKTRFGVQVEVINRTIIVDIEASELDIIR